MQAQNGRAAKTDMRTAETARRAAETDARVRDATRRLRQEKRRDIAQVQHAAAGTEQVQDGAAVLAVEVAGDAAVLRRLRRRRRPASRRTAGAGEPGRRAGGRKSRPEVRGEGRPPRNRGRDRGDGEHESRGVGGVCGQRNADDGRERAGGRLAQAAVARRRWRVDFGEEAEEVRGGGQVARQEGQGLGGSLRFCKSVCRGFLMCVANSTRLKRKRF